jgi:hypothetical protein
LALTFSGYVGLAAARVTVVLSLEGTLGTELSSAEALTVRG